MSHFVAFSIGILIIRFTMFGAILARLWYVLYWYRRDETYACRAAMHVSMLLLLLNLILGRLVAMVGIDSHSLPMLWTFLIMSMLAFVFAVYSIRNSNPSL